MATIEDPAILHRLFYLQKTPPRRQSPPGADAVAFKGTRGARKGPELPDLHLLHANFAFLQRLRHAVACQPLVNVKICERVESQ